MEDKSFMLNGEKVHVRGISISETNNMIIATAQKAVSEGFINRFLLEVYFYLHLIYLCTDIKFTEEDKADELALYGQLRSAGVPEKIIGILGEDNVNELKEYCIRYAEDRARFLVSAAGAINSIAIQLPDIIESFNNTINNLDESKIQEIQKIMAASEKFK